MTLAPTLERLLAALPAADQLEFPALLIAVEKVRFTGPLTIDFLNGLPRQINLGQPVKLAICHGDSGREGGKGLDTIATSGSG